jgi:hypothetical protein
MQLDLAAGFHVPCLVSKSGLQLDGHDHDRDYSASQSIHPSRTESVRDHAYEETFASSLLSFRSVPSFVSSDCTPSLSTTGA